MKHATSRIALVIPARWGSTRFPGKVLHPIAGKPLLRHVWERALMTRTGAGGISRILIATDDARIRKAAEAFGAETVMTSADHPSGTDRIAEAVSGIRGISHVINVQGDEPLIDPVLITRLASSLTKDPSLSMITAATRFPDPAEAGDGNCVKVVLARNGDALYFSRSPIPFHRDAADPGSAVTALLHLGIYGYRRDVLKKLVHLPPSPLEQCEKLEQLRALENGIPIRVLVTESRSIGVDTPEDVARVEAILKANLESNPRAGEIIATGHNGRQRPPRGR